MHVECMSCVESSFGMLATDAWMLGLLVLGLTPKTSGCNTVVGVRVLVCMWLVPLKCP